jgi:hypothetical protein
VTDASAEAVDEACRRYEQTILAQINRVLTRSGYELHKANSQTVGDLGVYFIAKTNGEMVEIDVDINAMILSMQAQSDICSDDSAA